MTNDVLIGPVECQGKHAFIRPDGSYAIPPAFEELGDFSEGLVSFRASDKIGFADDTGAVVIQPHFEELEVMPVFRSGLAPVRQKGRIGYITKSGHWQIPPIWSRGWNFNGPYALVEAETGYFVLDVYGEVNTRLKVFDIPWFPDLVSDWNCFRCLFATNSGIREGCVNRFGDVVFPPTYSHITDFYRGVAGFCEEEDVEDGRFGLVSFSGNVIKAPQYLSLRSFSEGLASAGKRDLDAGSAIEFGYVDKDGSWVNCPSFSAAYEFHEGLARVRIGGVVDGVGEWVAAPRYGYINKAGEWAMSPIFSAASDFKNGYAIVRVGASTALIDRCGANIWTDPATEVFG